MLYENLSTNNKGHLCFAGLDCVELAHEFGTPSYILDEEKIRERCKLYQNALKNNFDENSLPLFAGKALCFKELYRILKEENMGIDVVSSGEIFTAKETGFPLDKAFFHGNNKTIQDINFAIENRVGYFVCDNKSELHMLDVIASKNKVCQKVLIRITPGIDPHTHAKINTGKVDSKFGVAIETGQAIELVKFALNLKNICLVGFHCHIGSQIFEVEPFLDAAKIMIEFIAKVKTDFNHKIKILNLGGGMGVPYTNKDPQIDYAKYIEQIAQVVKAQSLSLKIDMPSIMLEPGRSIVADAGITLYSVGNIKEITGLKNYVSVDGGMTDNPRYTLYESPYTVLNASRINQEDSYICSIAGRCCESGDLIQENIKIARPQINDILAVITTGAYNYSMASNYNAIPKPPIIIIKNGQARIAVKRQTFEDLTSTQL